MEKKLRFPLNIQLFGDKGKGEVIDADKELEKVPLSQIDDDSVTDDEDYVDDDDEEEEDDDDSYIDDDDSDEDTDKDDKKDDKEDSSKKDDDKSKEDDKSKSNEEGDKDKDSDKDKESPKKPQNRDVNHEQKLLRERKEAEEKARKENFTKGFIAALGGKNPFTGDEIKTDDDIHEAQVMIEAKKRGLDPIQDYSKMDKILRQEEREKTAKAEEAKVQEQQKINEDIASFKEKYPDEDIGKFLDSIKESGYEDLVGKVSLIRIKKIIDDTNSKVEKAKEDEKDMKDARKQATPGSLSSGGDANGDYFSAEELKKMSPSEIKANWKKVERSYERLNHLGKGGKK